GGAERAGRARNRRLRLCDREREHHAARAGETGRRQSPGRHRLSRHVSFPSRARAAKGTATFPLDFPMSLSGRPFDYFRALLPPLGKRRNPRAVACPTPSSGDGILSAQTSTLIGAETGIKTIAAVHSQCRLWVISGQTIAGENPLLSAIVQKRTNFAAQRNDAMCHVWTAPSWQGLSSRLQHWSVQPCVRPVSAAHVAAGHN